MALKALDYDNLNENVKQCQYAVRGELYLRASELQKEGKKIIFTNVGNPHALGQKPLTFPRQVVALCQAPFLLDDPNVGMLFPADAIAKAKHYLSLTSGGLGAYSDSRGLPGVRKEVAEFIQRRDGYPSDPELIFLTDGASKGVMQILNCVIRGDRDGILVPVPQYPLYSATISLLGGTLVPYYLDESENWGLDVDNLRQSVAQARSKGISVRAMVIINPGNPTGQCLSEANLREMKKKNFSLRRVRLDLKTSSSRQGVLAASRRLLLMAEAEIQSSPTTEAPSLLNPSESYEVPAQKSYANAVGSKPSLTKFEVDVKVVDGKATVAVPDEILTDSVPLWDEFLVGRFPPSSPAPHVAKIHVIVNKIWNLGDKSIRIDAYSVNETTVKFRIRNVSARLRVLRRGMWNICDLPMLISKWTPFPEEAQPELRMMPMWVTIKNVPHSMFTWKGLSYIVSPVGNPKRLHPDTELVKSFDEAKIFVEVNLQKELPKIYYFNVQGNEFCVTYEYPWLPPKCGTCGKWGHSNDTCLANLGKLQTSPTTTTTTSAKKLTSQALLVESTPATTEISNSQLSPGKSISAAAKNNNSASNTDDSTLTTAPVHSSVLDVVGKAVGKEVETEEGEISIAHAAAIDENTLTSDSAIPPAPMAQQDSETLSADATTSMPIDNDTVEETIPSSSTPTKDQSSNEGEWSEVSISGGRYTNKNPAKSFDYGQVRIASPSRYSVLQDATEDGEIIEKVSEQMVEPPTEDTSTALTIATQKQHQRQENVTTRATLPRQSKNTHKFLSGSTQKARESNPSNINTRYTKNKP